MSRQTWACSAGIILVNLWIDDLGRRRHGFAGLTQQSGFSFQSLGL
ncbi:hypothetical protein [Dyella sp.]